jgi:hypothetical protein
MVRVGYRRSASAAGLAQVGYVIVNSHQMKFTPKPGDINPDRAGAEV